ncbi:hypothetical protein MAH1_12850 [Sessilibacter sp. MAH1]
MATTLTKHLAKVSSAIVFLIALASCAQDDPELQECPITIDSVTVLLMQTHNGRDYYLLKRISGWHEKTEIIQLYDQKPELDRCNKDTIKPIFEDSIEIDKNLIVLKADLATEEFELIYDNIKDDSENILLELKN